MTKFKLFAALLAGLFVFAVGPAQSAPKETAQHKAAPKPAAAQPQPAPPPKVEPASADDTARFLAGLPLSADSPLAALADGNWQQHVRSMDQAFASVEARQISKIRAWSWANLKSPQPNLYYLFSGPDFLYADAFFPDASTVVMVGLEPPGEVPNLQSIPRGYVPGVLGAVENSMRTLLQVTFFITNNMSHDLQVSALRGTLPVIYTFMARTGKHLRETTLVSLDDKGEEVPFSAKLPVRGAKITYTGRDDKVRTLYYFSANLANDGLKTNGLLKFLDKLGTGDAIVKSASYLLHGDEFSIARNFLLAKSVTLLQDDTGVPLHYFDTNKWDLLPYGHYVPPIPVFRYAYQQKMHDLFTKQKPGEINFAYGYHGTVEASNILVAVNRDNMDAVKKAAEEKAKAAAEKAAAEKAAAEKAAAEKAAAEKAAAEKAQQQPTEQATKKTDKAGEKPTEQSAAPPADKPAANAPEKPSAPAPTNAAAPSSDKPAETKTETRPADEKPAAPAEKQSDKPAEKPPQ